MQYSVVFTPEAEEQLVTIYRYIANSASPRIAERYTNAIINYCEGLATFPHRSVRRDEIRPGLLGYWSPTTKNVPLSLMP